MKAQSVLLMALCAAGLSMAALKLDKGRDARAAWAQADDPLIPGLAGSVDDVARMRIESTDGVTTVERRGDQWIVVERGGYEGRSDEVGRLLVALAEARKSEPKTTDPAKFARLGLAGTDVEDSPTVRLTLSDEGGKVLADVLVGDRRRVGAGEGWYVRTPDADETWSVEGKLRTPKRATEWLDTELLDIGRDRIAQVDVQSADGGTVHLARPTPDAQAFDIQNLPEGREPKSDRSGASFLGSLAALRLSDVHAPGDVEFPDPAPMRTTWTTSDGLVVSAELAEVGEEDAKELFCRFHVSTDAARLPEPASGPETADAPPAEDATEDDAAAEDPFGLGADEDAAPKSRAEVEAEAADLQQRLDGWVFVLPSWKKTSFTIGMEELLQPLPEPPPAEEAAPAEAAGSEGGAPAPAQDEGTEDGTGEGDGR